MKRENTKYNMNSTTYHIYHATKILAKGGYISLIKLKMEMVNMSKRQHPYQKEEIANVTNESYPQRDNAAPECRNQVGPE